MYIKPIALSFELNKKTNGRIQLFPFGRFYSQDGRTDQRRAKRARPSDGGRLRPPCWAEVDTN